VGATCMKHALVMGAMLAAAVPGAALAADSQGHSYSDFEISWVDLSLDGVANVDGDGFEIAGAYDFDKVYIFGKWQDQSFDFGIDGTALEFGAGLHKELNPKVDFVGTLSYLDQEVKLGGFSADDNGLGIGAGVRSRLADSFELDAVLRYVNFDEGGSDTGVVLTGRYYFNKTMAVTFGTDMTDDVDTLRVGFRAEF